LEVVVDVRLLRYFLAVATHLNFGRAAAALHTAQPALSQQIRKLENELGGALFERTKRYVALTPLGQELLPEAQAIVEQFERLTVRLRDRSKTPRGQLRIGAIAPATMGALARLLPSYRQSFPLVELSLATVGLDEQIRALVERRIDVGILRGPVDEELIHAAPIATEFFCMMLPSEHALAKSSVVQVRDLRGVTLVVLPPERAGSFNDDIHRLLNQHRVRPAQFLQASDVQAVFALIASGMGACLSSTVFCGVSMQGLVYRPLVPQTKISPLMLACRHDRQDVPVIRSMFEHISRLQLVFPPPV
jgi:DNA-binding transcriptional LysR family regulator